MAGGIPRVCFPSDKVDPVKFIWSSRVTNARFFVIAALDRLNLADNQIRVVGPGAFRKISSLHLLDLSRNEISEIHPDAFAEIRRE